MAEVSVNNLFAGMFRQLMKDYSNEFIYAPSGCWGYRKVLQGLFPFRCERESLVCLLGQTYGGIEYGALILLAAVQSFARCEAEIASGDIGSYTLVS